MGKKKRNKKPSKIYAVCAKSRSGTLVPATCTRLDFKCCGNDKQYIEDEYERALKIAWDRLERIKDVDGYTLHNQGGWRMVRVIIKEDLRPNPISKLEI